MNLVKAVFLCLIALSSGQKLLSQAADTIYASYKYILGDSDSKTDAKQLCFLEAKRLCLEQAGTFIRSTVTVENYQVTSDEINSYAAAFVKVEIVSQEFEPMGETIAVLTKVKAIVYPEEMKNAIEQVKTDAAMEKQLKEKESERQRLEGNVSTLKEKIRQATPQQGEYLKTEMTRALAEMEAFENRRENLRDYTRKAVEYIRIGMTVRQVAKIAGKPGKRIEWEGEQRLRYGLVWVIFEKGRVSCLVKEPHFQPKYRCQDYSNRQKLNVQEP